MKCLHVSKEERYQNAEEMLDDLGHYWEYDREFQKEQRKKAWLFGLALLACLAFGITAIICTLLENSTRKHNYMSYLQMAGNSQTKEEAVENYRKAIVLDPAREEAYQKLLKNCFLEDGEFSREESEVFRRIFIDYGKNGERNERALRKNASGYGNLCYEVGIAYFYKYEERNNKKYAGSYFEAAINTNCLTEQKNLRAKRLAVISDYYSKIGRIDEAGDVFVGYREYWLDLCAVSEGNIVQQDNERTALVMYEEIVSQIISNAVHFRNDNVTREELELQMEKIETHLKEDFKKSDEIIMAMLRQELDALRENIQRAKQVIASVYEEAE